MNIKSSVPRVGLLISILIIPTLLLALARGSLAAPDAPVTGRVSIPSGGGQANGASILPSLSADGTLVVFTSSAYNLVAGDNNGYADIFLHNRSNSMTERISLTSSGGASDGNSQTAVISPDGRYVAFASTASNLVASDFNFASDIFLHDRKNSQTGASPCSATAPRRIGGPYRPPSPPVGVTWRSNLWRPTWSAEIPTATTTSFSTIPRAGRRCASPSPATARKRTAARCCPP